jgi:hypothetical protein
LILLTIVLAPVRRRVGIAINQSAAQHGNAVQHAITTGLRSGDRRTFELRSISEISALLSPPARLRLKVLLTVIS